MKSPSLLISTETLSTWDPCNYCVIETDRTPEYFEAGHIHGSVFWPMTALFTPEFRLRTEPPYLAALLSEAGITPETTIVCAHNGEPAAAGWSAWLFWILTSFGHTKTVVLDGGVPKWRSEGRPIETAATAKQPTNYPVPVAFGDGQRASLDAVKGAVAAAILDARSEEEYRGEYYFDAPPQEGQRAGRIPNALHLPYFDLIRGDGTYRSPEELHAVCNELGIEAGQTAFTYCAVGIRSSLVWFGLKHLLHFSDVRNYDGSWYEWSRSGLE
ncbi:sulfurtransferase, partial [bacterium]